MNEQPSIESKPFADAPVNPEPSVSKKNWASLVKKVLIVGSLFLAVGIAAAVSIAMYRLPPTDPLVRAVGSRLPFPVASVNSDWIPFSEYFVEYDAMSRYVKETGETGLTDEKMTAEILNTLINEAVVQQLADKYNVAVSEEKVAEFLESAYEESGSKELFYKDVEDIFGWDEKTFTERIIHPFVLATQLEEAIQADASVQTEARSKIEGALTRLDAGEAFADVASEVGDAYITSSGGYIGYIYMDASYGEIPEEWYGVIESLEVGAYSGVVESLDAFAIIQVMDWIEGTDEEPGQTELSVVFMQKRTVDEVIQDYKDESRIKWFIGEQELEEE